MSATQDEVPNSPGSLWLNQDWVLPLSCCCSQAVGREPCLHLLQPKAAESKAATGKEVLFFASLQERKRGQPACA